MCRANAKLAKLTGFLSTVAFLFSCGCGGGVSKVAPALQAPLSLTYASATAIYMQGAPIMANTPSSTGGAITSYSATPPLPAGLTLSGTTGVVSGTPTSVTATTVYTVTASNSAGSTAAPLTITVSIAPPANLTYSTSPAFYTVGMEIAENVPSNTGGAVATYSVNPALPAGLALSPINPGIIVGIPTVATPAASYAVTASNSAGRTTAVLSITIDVAETSPAGLAYTTSAPVYASGVAIVPNAPSTSNIGGAPTSYSVSPFLPGGPGFPAGLALDTVTGIISGTPTAASSATAPPTTASYTVTASNSAGSTTAILTITLYNSPQYVPNIAQSITPLAPTNSRFDFLDTGMVVTDPLDAQTPPVEWLAGQAASSVVSPDGKYLLVLTSGYNRVFQAEALAWDPLLSTEYVFIYEISNHLPVFQQVVNVPNAYYGIVWDPVAPNPTFYVASGMGDFPFDSLANGSKLDGTFGVDNIHIVTQNPGTLVWSQTAELLLGPGGAGHASGNGIDVPNLGPASANASVFVNPCAAGLAISSDGNTLVVANYYNDSITVFTKVADSWGPLGGTEQDLRPGKAVSNPTPGIAGGEYPFWVVVAGSGANATAYVSSLRDREIDVVSLNGQPVVTARIPVKGQPNKMTLNQTPSQPATLLYVAEDESDTVDVISLKTNTVVESIPVVAPASMLQSYSLTQYTGANTNSVTLSPDQTHLYVTNGNLNNVAVVALNGNNPPSGDQVVGLIPTGWYPNSISISPDGAWAYVVNAKTPTGANPHWCYVFGPAGYPGCQPANQYNPQLAKAGLQSFPLASTLTQLSSLTTQVAKNNRFSNTSGTNGVMSTLHQSIQHVIYILKENRTYDQILGDLPRGNGDPNLALFGQPVTPNLHALALNFVTLDNFLDTAEVSNDGWPWSTSARAPDIIEHQYPVFYSQRGLSLDSEGTNRSVNVSIPTLAGRQAADPLLQNDPDLLPGQNDAAAPDGPNDEINTGYLWDAALRAGLTVRNYGFFIDQVCYNLPGCAIPLIHNPFASNTTVAYPANVALAPYTDQYFRGFDLSFPDYYRYTEWERDFDANYATTGLLPNLSLVRFMHDHTGNFGTAIDGVNTPDRDQADNDYAVGLLVEKIANSAYKNNTLIFILEDDAQDGGDHVDSHRSPAYVAGAYVKNAVVSTPYNTVNVIRTMEEILGLGPMNLNDALASPMSDVFNTSPNRTWTFTATPAAILYCTDLPVPPPVQPCTNPTPNAAYWARVTKGLDFTDADRVDGASFNRILWKGLMGDKPYPAAPTGQDLRLHREKLLADYRRSKMQPAGQKARTTP